MEATEVTVVIVVATLLVLAALLRRLGFRWLLLPITLIGLGAVLFGIRALVFDKPPHFMYGNHVVNPGPVTKPGPVTTPGPVVSP